MFKLLSSTIIAFSVAFASNALAAMDGKQIMEKNEEVRRINELEASAVLTTGGGQRTAAMKKFTWWRKLTEDNIHYNSLTKFHEPAEVRNEAILFLERAGGENEVLLWLPNFKKTRRVEGQQQSTSFMSSDFTYSDITTPHIDDYKYSSKKEEPCPGDTKVTCFVVEAIPATDAVKEKVGYSKTLNWMRKDNFMVSQMEYFDGAGKLYKRLQASETKKVDEKNGKWFSHRIRMEDLSKGQFTLLVFDGVKVNKGINNALFNKNNLGR